MSEYKTFEELKEELGDKFEEYMYEANIELLEKIREAREYIEKHRHKSSENFIQACANFIKEQEYLLSILDKENK